LQATIGLEALAEASAQYPEGWLEHSCWMQLVCQHARERCRRWPERTHNSRGGLLPCRPCM